MLVTNNSNKTKRVIYSRQQSLLEQIKPQSFESRRNSSFFLSLFFFFFFLPGDASHVYVGAWALGCFDDDDDELMLNVLRCHLTY